MSKTPLFLLLALLATWTLNAQKASDKAVKQCCDCISKLDVKKLKTEEAKNAAATDCMTQALMANIMGLADEYSIDVTNMNEETGRKIGEKFGIKLVTDCPAATPFLVKMAGDADIEKSTSRMMGYEREETTTGTLLRIETTGDATIVVVKTAEGEEEKLYWIRPFPGSETLETKGKLLNGKKVSVRWGEFKQYNATLKGYGKRKEILSIKIEE
jgi:hypothetical protein